MAIQYKQFHNRLKLSFSDILTRKVKVAGCQGTVRALLLIWEGFWKVVLWDRTFNLPFQCLGHAEAFNISEKVRLLNTIFFAFEFVRFGVFFLFYEYFPSQYDLNTKCTLTKKQVFKRNKFLGFLVVFIFF